MQDQYRLNRQLIAALVKRDTGRALRLVRAGADPNTPYQPLPAPSLQNLIPSSTQAASNRSTAFLMACGASHFQEDSSTGGENSFSVAPEDPRLVQLMLQHRANINAKDRDGATPLLCAIRLENYQTIGLLVEYGANVNAADSEGRTPLMAAAVDEDTSLDTLRLLLDHGADPNRHDRGGMTALQSAQNNRRSDLVGLLWQAGAKK